MLKLFLELGSTARREDPTLYVVDMPIPRNSEDLPATPAGRVLRAVARQELDPPVAADDPPSLEHRPAHVGGRAG